ncbi:MAG: VWA domain-containing protein [Pseudomonadota bacterium]
MRRVFSLTILRQICILSLWIIACIHAPDAPASAASPEITISHAGIDVALIVDLAPQGRSTTPPIVRLRTARTLLNQLKKQDRALVVGYTGKGIAYSDLIALDTPEHKQELFDLLAKLPAMPPQPFLNKAMEQTLKTLKEKRENTRQQLVALISDGGLAPGDDPKSATKTQKLLTRYVPGLASQGIRIYPIAHHEQANLPLLNILARDSNGRVIVMDNYQAHTATQLAQMLADNRRLRINKNMEILFNVSQDHDNLLIVAGKQLATGRYTLTTPKGEKWQQQNLPTAHRWLTNEKFDLIALRHPPLGAWKLSSTTTRGEIRYFPALRLHHNLSTAALPSGVDYVFEAWLTDDQGQPVIEEILDYFVVQVQVNAPQAAPYQVVARRSKETKDRFRAVLHLAGNGLTPIAIAAESPVAALVAQLNIDVTGTMFPTTETAAATPTTATKPATAEAAPAATVPHEKSLSQKATVAMLDSLEYSRQKLEPLVEHASEYTQTELLPKMSAYIDHVVMPRIVAHAESVAPELAPALRQRDAKIWIASGIGGLFMVFLLLRRWWRKHKAAARRRRTEESESASAGDEAALDAVAASAGDSTPPAAAGDRFDKGEQFQLDEPAQSPINPNDGLAELEENVRMSPT